MPDAKHDFLTSPAFLEQFLDSWEAGTLPKPQWTHAAHVAVGACYTVRFGASALEHTRAGIRRYNEAVGTVNGPDSGYHETLTRFWSIMLGKALVESTTHGPPPAKLLLCSAKSAACIPAITVLM